MRPGGLLARILLALLAVGVAPLAVLSLGLIGFNRDAMSQQVLRTHAVAAQTTAQRIDAFLAARRYLLTATAGRAALLRDPRSAAATAQLSDLLASPLGVAAVVVRNDRDEEVVRVQRSELAPVVRHLLAPPDDGAGRVGSGVSEGWLRLSTALPDRRGRLLVICDLVSLSADLKPHQLGPEADLVVADRSGDRVLGDAATLASYPPAMLAVALDGRLAGASRFAAPDGDVLGAYAPVPGTAWTVLSRQPAAVAARTALQLRRRSLLAVTAALLLVLAGAITAQRSLVRPIRGLIEAQQRLAGPAGERPAGGEIEQLLRSFELLEQRLGEREELGRVFLGRYQVVEVIGTGAMGTVFRGWDPTLERPLALKTVRLGNRGAAGGESSRLVDEAVAIARFNHPNIVGIYDVQQSSGVAFLAMEYVDGACLEDVLTGRGRCAASEVVALGLAIAEGLAAAHARGILHRDIKPSNILLGRDGAVKIADFGIAQSLAALVETPEDSIFGTPGYIPPETLAGRGYSPQGDVFALGVTLYRLLTGELPFRGSTMAELILHTIQGAVEPPGSRVPGVPPAVDAAVAWLLDRDPRHRCGSAHDAVRRLRELAVECGAHWQLRPDEGVASGLEPTWPLTRGGLERIAQAAG